MATFIGLDLAWKATNESGVCWLEGGTPADLVCRRLDAEARSVENLAEEIAEGSKGKELKRLEDKLDGLTCALGGWLWWSNKDAWETIGDSNGYMVVPLAGEN